MVYLVICLQVSCIGWVVYAMDSATGGSYRDVG